MLVAYFIHNSWYRMYLFFAPVIPPLNTATTDTHIHGRKAMWRRLLIAALLTS